jgi:hypothetical protein
MVKVRVFRGKRKSEARLVCVRKRERESDRARAREKERKERESVCDAVYSRGSQDCVPSVKFNALIALHP